VNGATIAMRTEERSDPQAVEIRDFDRSLPMALLRARESVMRRFRPVLAAHDLTEQQWRVLRALADADAARSVGQLAEDTCLLGPSLSRMLASLEGRGLVRRGVHAEDARRSDVEISSRGRQLVATVGPRSEAQYRRIEACFEPGELDQLHRLLDRLSELSPSSADPSRSR
jgi:homoprotocatechuate degradation regulator HpaR